MKADGRTQLVVGIVLVVLAILAAIFVSYLFIPLAILLSFMVGFGLVDRASH